MTERLRAAYNPWFLIPFLLWVVVGAVLLLVYGSPALFTAVNTHHTPLFDHVMFALTWVGEGWVVAILLLALLLIPAWRKWWYVLAAILCNVVPGLIATVLKEIFHAPRPLEYFHNASWIHIEDQWHHLYSNSFPSGHATSVFSMCCFLSMIMPKHKAWLGLVFLAVALFVAYTRMYLAAHFFMDIYVGSLLGTSVSLLCFALMRRWSNKPLIIGQ